MLRNKLVVCFIFLVISFSLFSGCVRKERDNKMNAGQPFLNQMSLPRLRRAQRKIASSPARFKVVACGRRWGKTTLGMVMAVHHALSGYRVWWVAPTYLMAFYPWLAFKRRFALEWASKIEYTCLVRRRGYRVNRAPLA